MSTYRLVDQTVSADIVGQLLLGGNAVGEKITQLWLKMKTVTPGAGQLLVGINYGDSEGVQTINVALNLTAGNYTEPPFEIWWDYAVDVTLDCTFLSPGGTCSVILLTDA